MPYYQHQKLKVQCLDAINLHPVQRCGLAGSALAVIVHRQPAAMPFWCMPLLTFVLHKCWCEKESNAAVFDPCNVK